MTLKTMLGVEMGRNICRQTAGGFLAWRFSVLGGCVTEREQPSNDGDGDDYGFDDLSHGRAA